MSISWGIIWGKSRGSSGACLGHQLGIIWGISGASSGACLEHQLGHVWGIIWACLGHVWSMSGTCLGHLLLVCLSLLDVELLKYCPPLALKPTFFATLKLLFKVSIHRFPKRKVGESLDEVRVLDWHFKT